MANWTPPPPPDKGRRPATLGIDWAGRNDQFQPLTHIDPYLVWLDVTAAQPVLPRFDGGPMSNLWTWVSRIDLVTVVVELRTKGSNALRPPDNLYLFPTYSMTMQPVWRRVQPCVLPRDKLVRLIKAVSDQDKNVVRFELSMVRTSNRLAFIRGVVATLARLDAVEEKARIKYLKDLGLPPTFDTQVRADLRREEAQKTRASNAVILSAQASFAAKAGTPCLAIIDDLCPFASPRLQRSDLRQAVRYLWDQGLDAQVLARRKAGGADLTDRFVPVRKPGRPGPGDIEVDNGMELMAPDAGSQAKGNAAGPEDEESIYRRVGYVDRLRHWGHGTAVTHAAAEACGLGHAPDMIWVQLPDATVTDTSGGSLSAFALDGIQHVLERAAQRPVVLNLSYGTYSGGHDGTSLFETGLKTFLDLEPRNLRVVLPAGNSHLARGHSSFWVRAGDGPHELMWKTLPDDATDSYLELWFPESSNCTVAVVSPAGERVQVEPGHVNVLKSADTEHIRAAVVYPCKVPQGTSGRMCLIALAPSRFSANAESAAYAATRLPLLAQHGVWRIQVSTEGEPAYVHAWIQRDDAAPGRGPASRGWRGRQSYFLEAPQEPLDPTSPSPVDPCFTLNGIATLAPHDRLRVVGALRANDQGVALYSSAGPLREDPSRSTGPDVCSVADYSLSLPGLLVAGSLSASRLRVGGTSLAAAVVTGMWHKHLSAGKPDHAFAHAPTAPESHQPPHTEGEPQRAADWLRASCNRVDPETAGVRQLVRGPAAV